MDREMKTTKHEVKERNKTMAKFTQSQLDFMRQDLENNFALSRMIDGVRDRLESEGKDFDAEFEKWKKENGKK
jgi:hypothetical protein